MTKLQQYESELQNYPNDRLITEEISHRRFIASYITSLTLTCSSAAASAGTLLPLTIPICAFKANKIRVHRKQLKMVRRELERRCLTPMDKRKRDVLVPVAAAFTIYAVTFGIADAIDVVPEGVQEALHDKIEGLFGVADGTGGLDKVGNTYEAFILAEAATPLTNALVQHGYKPGCPPPLPPRPKKKDQ
ncbi:hypothetical protein BN14_05657 [Rhizoctonia solani AG-1 IB]|uniref:Uncharacterized protein n=2 Tax=Rhizoctonia solani TaxID=456999 RepID=A0A8H3GCS8_9AGAM|nr:unnamed protein product [Rhizoctonia solani]CCO31611.1 hypothetical protein BN14_05657 [Rhizoctonia solani AG-1 IB]